MSRPVNPYGDYATERSPFPYWSDDYMRSRAAAQNLEVLYDDETTLLLDIDRPYEGFMTGGFEADGLNDIQRKMDFVQDLGIADFAPGVPLVLRSKSGNVHVIVKLADPEPNVTKRIFLQALLGSDLKRATLSYAGVLHGQEHPNVLFRPRPT